jgi:hypothetical protein
MRAILVSNSEDRGAAVGVARVVDVRARKDEEKSMKGVTSVQDDLRGISGGDPRSDLRARAERQLADLLHAERIPPRAVYRPGEVCQLLRISRSTLLALCELAEHPAARPANPRALDSFLVGCHHRIAHASLVVWLERNQKFQRDSA